MGEQGPCGEMMIFYAHPENEDLGECDCDLSFRCHRPMIYWAPASRCYWAYEQVNSFYELRILSVKDTCFNIKGYCIFKLGTMQRKRMACF